MAQVIEQHRFQGLKDLQICALLFKIQCPPCPSCYAQFYAERIASPSHVLQLHEKRIFGMTHEIPSQCQKTVSKAGLEFSKSTGQDFC
jgi:hypothetical protein